MSKIGRFPCVLCFSAAWICLSSVSRAEDLQGKLGIGVRGGAAFLTQDIAGDTKGHTGPIVNGNILYGINRNFSLGLTVEWETHRGADLLGIDIGDASTVSLIPTVEFRPFILGPFYPYGTLGAGVNLNSFHENHNLRARCLGVYGGGCHLEPDATLAVKVGVGVDYFFPLMPDTAFNTEAGWKSNSGDNDLVVGGRTVETDDFHSSVFTLLVGLRYYF